MEYTVSWVIGIDADSARDAAEIALRVQRDPHSTATAFVVDHLNEEGNTEVEVVDFHEDLRAKEYRQAHQHRAPNYDPRRNPGGN